MARGRPATVAPHRLGPGSLGGPDPARAPSTTSGGFGGGGFVAVDVRERPLDLIQRQVVADVPPPVEPKERRPEDDPRFQSVEQSIAGKAARAKKHPHARAEARKAQAAAVAPPNDERAQAKAAQADKMAAAKPGTFDKAAFVAAVKKAIDAAAPKSLEEADKFGSSGKTDAVKAEVKGKVTTGKQESAREISDTSKQPPDASVAKEKPVVPLAETKATKPKPPSAGRAMPETVPPEQTDLRAGKAESDALLEQEDVSEDQLKASNEPEFQAAAEAKKASDEHAAKAPEVVRAKEAETLAAAKSGATDSGTAAIAEIGASSATASGKVGSEKTAAKSKDEAERARVAAEVNAIYDATKKQVDDTLGSLDEKVDRKFEAGEAEARRLFTVDHKERMDRYKSDRYSGLLGGARWTRDLFAGLPAEGNNIYAVSRKLYEQKMETVIGDVADLIGSELQKARDLIAEGREKIRQYVEKQPKNLRKVAQEAAKDVGDRFDELESEVDSKQESLVSDLATKYVEAAKAVDDEIKALQEENKGLVAKTVGAIAGVIATLRQLNDLLFSVLARAAGAIKNIIKDPIGFLGNLVSAVKAGVIGFKDRILDHIKNGLLSWLFGELASTGIELPEKFDLKGILKLVLGLLGMTYATVRARAVKAVGPKVMEKLEQSVDVFKVLVAEGPAGLWTFIADKIGALKEQVVGEIKEFVVTKIIVAGITWLISLLNPASAFIKACKAIVDIVMFLVNRASQIKEFVESVLDSVEAIAAGGAGRVASLIEGTLAKMIPLLIGFLASLLGVGGISEKIKSVLQAIQKPVTKAIDAVINGALKAGKRLFKGAGKLFAKGKGYVKGKVAAGRAWARRQIAGGKDRLKATLGLTKPKPRRTPAERKAALSLAMHQGQLVLANPETTIAVAKSKLSDIRSGTEVDRLELIVDQDTPTVDLVHLVGSNSPQIHGPPTVKPKVQVQRAGDAGPISEQGPPVEKLEEPDRARVVAAVEVARKELTTARALYGQLPPPERGKTIASGGGVTKKSGAGSDIDKPPPQGASPEEVRRWQENHHAMWAESGKLFAEHRDQMMTPAKGAPLATPGAAKKGKMSDFAYPAANVAEQKELMDKFGQFVPIRKGASDVGIPGSEGVTHAERQVHRTAGGAPIGVSRPMCPTCQAYFRSAAQAAGDFLVVADTERVHIFLKDGTVKQPSDFK